MAGFGEVSPGKVNVMFSVKVAPLTAVEFADVEVALKTPKVMLEDSPGFKFTLSSFGSELKVIVVGPTVRTVPPPLTEPPLLPAPNTPVVPAVKVTGAAEAETIPIKNRVNAPSSKSVACFLYRIIIFS